MKGPIRRRRLTWLACGLAALAGGVWAAAWLVPLPARLAASDSVVVSYRDGTPAHVFLAEDGRWRVPVRLETLDPAYVEALLKLEDRRFAWHPGVDPLAMVRSAALNLSRGRRVSGASTLTMQLVRVLEPRPRTWASKAIEALRAMQLELRLDKDEILRSYLQFVPYGRNLEGVETASIAYFGHGAGALSAAEVATLLAVPQNPNRRYPTQGNADRLRRARDDIAERLSRDGVLPVRSALGVTSDAAVLEGVRESPVPTRLQPFPREAPHAARWFVQQRPGEVLLRTTLDAGLQRLAERVMASARAEARTQGIHNGAAVLVDHHGGEVLALVGNFDFWDAAHGGQIAGFATPRSPGSTLKPLIYSLAIEQGLAGPEQLISDVPMVYGTYAPRNFDGEFMGLVRLEEALSRSLNLPFIELLRGLGVDAFLHQLRRQGVTSLSEDPGAYGLSLAVGGIELTPLELTGLFATLARGGTHLPLRWWALDDAPEEELAEPVRIYSEGAAWLTRQALSLRDRPDFPSRRRMTGAPAHIHWKTGTSFGHRDAWSIGSGPDHTAAVWLGNFDASPSVHLTGSEAAGPLLFDLLDGVAVTRAAPPSQQAPQDLTRVEVCAYSGHLPTDACPTKRTAWALLASVPTKPCPFHRKVAVDTASGLAVRPGCREGLAWEERSFLVWPASIRRWLDDQRRVLPEPPPWAPGCEGGAGSSARPVIVSPPPGQVALLLPGVPPEQQDLAFTAEAPGGVGELSWFVDGELVGTAPSSERVWWTPSEGTHEILVSAPDGRSARRTLEVRVRR